MSFQNRFRCLFLNQDYKSLDKTVVSVSIPSITTGINIFPTAVKPIFYPGDSLEFNDLSINFRLDEDYQNFKTIMDWIYTNKNFKSNIQDTIFSDISIQLGDLKKNIIYSIDLIDCFPFDISGLDFDTRISDIEGLIFNVIFKVNNLEFR